VTIYLPPEAMRSAKRQTGREAIADELCSDVTKPKPLVYGYVPELENTKVFIKSF